MMLLQYFRGIVKHILDIIQLSSGGSCYCNQSIILGPVVQVSDFLFTLAHVFKFITAIY